MAKNNKLLPIIEILEHLERCQTLISETDKVIEDAETLLKEIDYPNDTHTAELTDYILH